MLKLIAVDFKLACFVFFILVRPGTSVTTYTWCWKVLDVDSARPLTDPALFNAHATQLATEALLLPGHVFGTASRYTCTTKTYIYDSFKHELKQYWL